ncbi:MAG: methyltransferase domain-containing protein [bacterium]
MKPRPTNNKKGRNSKSFWDKEYKSSEHLMLSTEPSSDMVKFCHWAERNSEWFPFPKQGLIIDVGCGNGRNVTYLCETYKMRGLGFDISEVAVNQARKIATEKKLAIEFKVQSAKDPLPAKDESFDIVLDMMTSHFLNQEERALYLTEVVRVLKPFGWFFFKSFIIDEDAHAHRLLREHPGEEKGTYIHPKIGVAEHVWGEEELRSFLEPNFIIHKFMMSHKHMIDGKPWKRRTVSVYAEKKRAE